MLLGELHGFSRDRGGFSNGLLVRVLPSMSNGSGGGSRLGSGGGLSCSRGQLALGGVQSRRNTFSSLLETSVGGCQQAVQRTVLKPAIDGSIHLDQGGAQVLGNGSGKSAFDSSGQQRDTQLVQKTREIEKYTTSITLTRALFPHHECESSFCQLHI